MRFPLTVAVALLGVLALTSGAVAFTVYNYSDTFYGDPMPLFDGRYAALGGAGIASADGVRGLSLNPALVGKTDGIEFAVTGMLIDAEEAREAPVHDSFDGIVAYNTYALNTNLYDRYVGAVSARPTGLYDWAPAVAIGYRPRLDMSYHYHVQFRDPDTQAEPLDKILYDYYADADGGVNALTVALGQEVVDDVYVGLGVDFLRGDFDYRERKIHPPGSSDPDSTSWRSFDGLTGTQFTLGVLVEALPRVDVGVVYRSSFTLEGDYTLVPNDGPTADATFEQKYPYAFAVGFQYHPRNEILTTLSFDIEYTKWSELSDSLVEDVDLDDTVEYRVGVEHAFYDDSYARFGFRYEPSYIDGSSNRVAFCFGLGLDVVGVRVDLGGQLGLREYEGADLERIRETTVLAMATVAYSF